MTNNEFKRALQEIKTLKDWLEYWQQIALDEYIIRFGHTPVELHDDVFIDMLQYGCANPNIKHIIETAEKCKEYVISEGFFKTAIMTRADQIADAVQNAARKTNPR